MKTKDSLFLRSIIVLFLVLLFLFTIFPVFYTLMSSFKSNQDIMVSGSRIFPTEFVLENYRQAWTLGNFKKYTWNSVYMTFFIVVGTLVNTAMGGYVFARGKFPGKKFVFALFTSTMFVSMGSLTIYPLLDVAMLLKINTSLWGVILINVFGLHVASLYLIRSFVTSIPHEIDEAAKLDGCGFFKTFLIIILPLMKPILATVGLITFKEAWNDYLLPMVFTLPNPDNAPLVVGVVALRSTGEAAGSWNLMMAGTMLSVIPMIVVYLMLNRYFISGMVNGAVKG